MKQLGNKWRILAHGELGTRVEENSDVNPSEFDELVIGNATDPCWFHLEQMTERDWWFAFYIDEGRRVCGNMRVFTTKPNEFQVWTEFDNERFIHIQWPEPGVRNG